MIVALALEDAVDHFFLKTIPAIDNDALLGFPAAAEMLRFFVVLLLATRFFLGAIIHFDDMYGWEMNEIPAGSLNRLRSRLLLDALSGLAHFIIVWALSVYIAVEVTPHYFRWMLLFILGYDAVWLAITPRTTWTFNMVWWGLLNWLTVLVAGIAYFGGRLLGFSPIQAEVIPLFLVAVASAADLASMYLGGVAYVKMRLYKLARRLARAARRWWRSGF